MEEAGGGERKRDRWNKKSTGEGTFVVQVKKRAAAFFWGRRYKGRLAGKSN